MNELCIIPCGNKKIWSKHPKKQAVPADEAYIGTFHHLCKSYAHQFLQDYVILSAKHGFLRPEDLVPGPYDVSFSMNTEEVITSDQLSKQLYTKSLHQYERYVVLTGKKYLPILDTILEPGAALDFPLLDCQGIGYMQRKLKNAVATDEPIHGEGSKVRRKTVEST
ncbi:hypothetical protein CR194_06415 [Salipaludibacillus keqinensis]|uniref:DUF6884 domain-containing protein n=1 Tax=Salipaludibacillus keqinensis TaxID=2045207 RepID=A0A323TM78_9BACI|nr:DUF6884 domain-containing protein [Salipaludibacillus keqinensis]PYZ95144.1 hypothetical protein CR194_06415 [Salipaludibacillus keqinensis]